LRFQRRFPYLNEQEFEAVAFKELVKRIYQDLKDAEAKTA